jgi:stress-induced morphogen
MAMNGAEIAHLIKEALPDAEVTMVDLAGDGDHWSAQVTSEAFRGHSRVRQHQMVFAALKGAMAGPLHALAIETALPDAASPGGRSTEPVLVQLGGSSAFE